MKKLIVYILFLLATSFMVSLPALCDEAEGNWIDKITMSGAVEVEAGYASDFADNNAGDIDLATAELGVEATATEWATGFVLFTWDGDTETVIVEEAHITFENTKKHYLTTGRLYIPFGAYETNMISDPLTLEIGEANEGALQVGTELSDFYASAYLFNGDINEADEDADGDDQIKNFGLNAGYTLEGDAMEIDIGAGWVSNIMDSDGLGDYLCDNNISLKDYVSGYAIYAIAYFGPFDAIIEYVGAGAKPEVDDGTGYAKMDPPAAWNVEIGYTFDMAGKETTVAAGYQRTDNCLDVGLPESRIIAAIGIGLAENLNAAMEFAQDSDYATGDGGTGESATAVTLQLALEF